MPTAQSDISSELPQSFIHTQTVHLQRNIERCPRPIQVQSKLSHVWKEPTTTQIQTLGPFKASSVCKLLPSYQH